MWQPIRQKRQGGANSNRADDDNCRSRQIKERPNHLHQPSSKILQLLFLLSSRQSHTGGIILDLKQQNQSNICNVIEQTEPAGAHWDLTGTI